MKIIISSNNTRLDNGNKANNIVTLLKNNINAPKTWIINYKYIMDVIKKELKIDLNEIQKDYSKVYNFLDNIPNHIYSEVLHEIDELKLNNKDIRRFAIRSSHIYEDGNNFSFSGLFKTELNLANSVNIANAIFKCWRDCFTSGIASYSHNSNIKKIIPCSIILQEFIVSDVSGVIFRSGSDIFVNCTYGMAKSIVDGETGFDMWKINSKTLEIKEYKNTKNKIYIPVFNKTNPKVGEKIPFLTNTNNMLVIDKFNNIDSYILASLNNEMARKPSLNNDELLDLVKLCNQVADKLDVTNYDIEWAKEKDNYYILQCRSLTRNVFYKAKSSKESCLPLVGGKTTGVAYFVDTENDAKNFPQNGIIVAKNLSGPVLLATNKASGCILESKSPLSHSAIIARELGIPAVGAVNRDKICNGKIYEINGDQGTIRLIDDNNFIENKQKKDIIINNIINNDNIASFIDVINCFPSDINKLF